MNHRISRVNVIVRIVAWAVLAQLFGVVLVCVAVGMLADVWWAVGVAGAMLLAGGTLAERAGGS